jgi:type IV pilus assembly protein PilW
MNGQSLWTRRQSGFGLIELMVAMAIGLLMLLGILTMFTWVSQARVALDKTSEQLENGRYVTQLLSDEVQMAGFYGVPQIAAEVFTNPTPCATALADLQFGFIVNKNTKPVPVYGYSAGSTLPACLSSALAGSEALVVRRVATTPIPVASVGSGSAGMYVQASSCSSDTQILKTGKIAANFSSAPLLRQKDCATSVTSVWPYLSRTYFLSAPSGVPTLSVAELDNSGIRIIPLAEGVEDMHLSYGLDFDADGSPDCFADDLAGAQPAQCPSWAGSELDKWSNVTAVSIRFLVRSTETFRGWTDTRTYDLGRAAASGPFNDAYKRQVFSVAIPLPNVGGPRE